MAKSLVSYKPARFFFNRHTLAVLFALSIIVPPFVEQPRAQSGVDAAAPPEERGEEEEGTFVTIDAISGSRTVNGNTEMIVKPNSEVQIEVQPTGNTHTVTTDSGGNFALDRQNLSKDEVNEISATFTVPICLWQWNNPKDYRICQRISNQFTMRWRKHGNDGKNRGTITPSGSVTLNTGLNNDTDIAKPAGSDAGRFQTGPILGDYMDGNGTIDTTIINVMCIDPSRFSPDYHPVAPPDQCGNSANQSLVNLPPYTVTMTVETINTRDSDTGLEDDEALDLAETIRDTYVAGLKKMTAQFTSTLFQQAAIVGSFFDVWGQQSAQRTLQRKQAEAVKDYMPGKAMCRFGSLASSQAGTDAKMRANKLALDAYMMGRETNKAGRNAGLTGPDGDVLSFIAGQSRLRQFKELHCFEQQNSTSGLEVVCGDITPTARDYADSPSARYNRDIDYTRLLAANNTLNFDMTDDELTADEEDIMSLSRRLYAEETFLPLHGDEIGDPDQNYYRYMQVRSINAARSVARNSFTDYVAKKAKGSGKAAGTHMRALLQELGLASDKAETYTGANNPSYHAQMDVLNKKIYQDPAFVAELYDTPTNVTRQHVFMYARKLIQRREIYKSLKKREMMLASLLEMRLRDVQDDVNSRLPVVGQSFQPP